MSVVNGVINVRTAEYLPLFYVPLPQKHNPVVVLPVRNNEIGVSVELTRERGLELVEVDSMLEKYVLDFYQFICDELGVNYGFRVSVEGEAIHRGFTYVVITNTLTKALAGRLDENVYDFFKLIDGRLGINQCITALRYYEKVREAYIWRYGDEVVRVGRAKCCVRQSLGVDNPTLRNSVLNDSRVNNILTHLIGLTIIGVYEAISEGSIGKLYDYVNLLNGLWEGTNVFSDYIKCRRLNSGGNYIYVQDIGRVLLLEVELYL